MMGVGIKMPVMEEAIKLAASFSVCAMFIVIE
jgi:hypothetical protein